MSLWFTSQSSCRRLVHNTTQFREAKRSSEEHSLVVGLLSICIHSHWTSCGRRWHPHGPHLIGACLAVQDMPMPLGLHRFYPVPKALNSTFCENCPTHTLASSSMLVAFMRLLLSNSDSFRLFRSVLLYYFPPQPIQAYGLGCVSSMQRESKQAYFAYLLFEIMVV